MEKSLRQTMPRYKIEIAFKKKFDDFLVGILYYIDIPPGQKQFQIGLGFVRIVFIFYTKEDKEKYNIKFLRIS